MPSEKCEASSLGLELPSLGLGLAFYDKLSVSSRNLSQVSVSVSVSEVTVSTTPLVSIAHRHSCSVLLESGYSACFV